MPKLLSLYLMVTGGLALVALAAPWLVVVGSFLILPGLILAVAPTAFLWGCIFAGSWFATRTILGDSALGFVVAGAIAAAVVVAVTQPNRAASQVAYQASLLPDVTPHGRIAIKGAVRIDLPRPNWDNLNPHPQGSQRGFSCDNLCVALLFTPGVTSVTINSLKMIGDVDQRNGGAGGFDPEARTYRLMPRSECGAGLKPDLNSRGGLYPADPKAGAALSAQWNLRFATDVCLVRSDPIGQHDILIRQGRYGDIAYNAQPWRLSPRKPWVEFIELRSGAGEVLFRKFKSSVRMLSKILWISPEGGMENFRFGWGTTILGNKRRWDPVDLLPELEAHTDIVGRFSGADMLPEMRKQLNAALANPQIGPDAPAFQLLAAYFDALPNRLSDEDLAIVTGLSRDNRITDYDGLWNLVKLPIDQQMAIRSALVERALQADEPVRLQRSRANLFLERMPKGSFAELTASEERLLTLADSRPALPSLVARLDESSGDRVPLLLSTIREHSLRHRRLNETQKGYENSQKIDAERHMVMAARTALCRMGPRAGSALGPLRKMVANGIVQEAEYSGSWGESWDMMMVRIGLPISELRKKENSSGTDEGYREIIRQRLERFDPDRDC